MAVTYARLLSADRLRKSKISDRTLATETDSDHGRVLFSTAFRRLQQKTQVFPLEDNAAVRSRLTHSLEVAYIGRLIALEVLEIAERRELLEKWELKTREIAFRNIVETACLVHDIGNPPFGHFGEYAIREWFSENATSSLQRSVKRIPKAQLRIFSKQLLPDLTSFDGNAQGLRILTRLQWNTDEHGLNLTFSQLAAFLKYLRAPYEPETKERFKKKPGYFVTEESIVAAVWQRLGLKKGRRFPLVYIMEASDDIAYCLSDIEDALEKGIITEDEFKTDLLSRWNEATAENHLIEESFLLKLFNDAWKPASPIRSRNANFFEFKVGLTRALTKQAAETYVDNHDKVLSGQASSLLEILPTHHAALECLKTYSRQNIFNAPEAERRELAGFQVVKGLLGHFRPLLELPPATFSSLSKGERIKGFDLEKRLFNLLPKKHLLVYAQGVTSPPKVPGVSRDVLEWFLRAHLVADFISGMTDRYALETYQLLAGIRVK